jgi:hypothetical protein
LRGLQQAVHLEKSVSTGQGSCHGQHAAPRPSTRGMTLHFCHLQLGAVLGRGSDLQ